MINKHGQLICHFCKATMRLATVEPLPTGTIARFECQGCGTERTVNVVSLTKTATKLIVRAAKAA